MFFQMKFKFSKKIKQFMILYKSFFVFNWIVMLSSKSV